MTAQQSRSPLDALSSLSPFGVPGDRPHPMRPAQQQHPPGASTNAHISQQPQYTTTHHKVQSAATPPAHSAMELPRPRPSQPPSHPTHDTWPLPPSQPPTSTAAAVNAHPPAPHGSALPTCAVPQLAAAPTPHTAPPPQLSGHQPPQPYLPHTSHDPFGLLALDTSRARSAPHPHSTSLTAAAHEHPAYGSSPQPHSHIAIPPSAAAAAAAAPSAAPSAAAPSAAATTSTCRSLLDDTPSPGYPALGPEPFHPGPPSNPAHPHHHPHLPAQPRAATALPPPCHTSAAGQVPPPHGHYPLQQPAAHSPNSTAPAPVALNAVPTVYGHPAASPYPPPNPYHAAGTSNSSSSNSQPIPPGPASFYSPAAAANTCGTYPATALPYGGTPVGFGYPPHAPHLAYYPAPNHSGGGTKLSSSSSTSSKPGGDAPLSLIAAKSLGGLAVVALQRSALAMGKFAGKLEKGVAKLQEKEARRQEKKKAKY